MCWVTGVAVNNSLSLLKPQIHISCPLCLSYCSHNGVIGLVSLGYSYGGADGGSLWVVVVVVVHVSKSEERGEDHGGAWIGSRPLKF